MVVTRRKANTMGPKDETPRSDGHLQTTGEGHFSLENSENDTGGPKWQGPKSSGGKSYKG